jgi:hypothetical protein
MGHSAGLGIESPTEEKDLGEERERQGEEGERKIEN